MKVAIAGAGAVGRSLARELLENGHDVTLIDRDCVEFLARCEEDHVNLENCPAFIREWIEAERGRKNRQSDQVL